MFHSCGNGPVVVSLDKKISPKRGNVQKSQIKIEDSAKKLIEAKKKIQIVKNSILLGHIVTDKVMTEDSKLLNIPIVAKVEIIEKDYGELSIAAENVIAVKDDLKVENPNTTLSSGMSEVISGMQFSFMNQGRKYASVTQVKQTEVEKEDSNNKLSGPIGALPKFDSFEQIENENDVIKIAMSASQKNVLSESSTDYEIKPLFEINSTVTKDKDELSFDDYSQDKDISLKVTTLDKKVVDFDKNKPVEMAVQVSELDKPISQNVLNAVQREMNDQKMNTQNLQKLSSNQKRPSQMLNHDVSIQRSSVIENAEFEYSISTVKLNQVSLLEKGEAYLSSYSFVPLYDENTELFDTDGEIEYKFNLKDGHGTLNGSFHHKDIYTVNTDLYLEDDVLYEIPVFARNEFDDFLTNLEYEGEGGYLLLELDSTYISSDIDVEYSKKVYLTKDFKLIDDPKQMYYALYLGVRPGNVMLTVQNQLSGNDAKKLVLVRNEEITFEIVDFKAPALEKILISTDNVFAKKKIESDLTEDEIGYYAQNIKFKTAGNQYIFKRPSSFYTFKDYFEIIEGDGTIYVGNNSKKEIIYPSVDFMNSILKEMQLEDLTQNCLIQINLDKNQLQDFKFTAEGSNGLINLELLALYEDGTIGSEVSADTRKIFLLGDVAKNQDAYVGIKIENAKNEITFANSFCSNGVYLVEQF